jgi:hypothetical protein
MIILAAIGLLVGAALGLRFSVFILIPAICFALIIAAVDGIARGHEVWWIASTMVIAATSIQVGYIGGIVVRSASEVMTATRDDRKPMPTSTRSLGLPDRRNRVAL